MAARATRDAAVRTATRAAAPDGRIAFVVGCPRSGTTWVQQLLAHHPEVGTTQETHLFQAYLGPLAGRWRRELEAWEDEERAGERGYGLSPVVTDEEFHRMCGAFARGVLERARAASGHPSVLVEKTPGHLFHADLIARVVPTARFVHVVRDPRDVVSSLLRASRRWWGGWAPSSPVTAARWWRSHVEAGLGLRDAGAAHLEVRYEDLHRDAAAQLGRMAGLLDLEADGELCERAAESCRIDRLRSGEGDRRSVRRSDPPPDGFYGRGEAGGWRGDFGPGALAAVEAVTGDLMRELGYEPETRAGRDGRTPWRLRLRRAVGRVRDATDRGFDALLDRI